MPDKKIDFETYLMEQHAKQYSGYKDMMADDFAEWLADLSVEQWLEFGNAR